VEGSTYGGFLNNQFAFGTSLGAVGVAAYPQGLGNRNVQLTGKIIF
jgi:hypothetical protein